MVLLDSGVLSYQIYSIEPTERWLEVNNLQSKTQILIYCSKLPVIKKYFMYRVNNGSVLIPTISGLNQ